MTQLSSSLASKNISPNNTLKSFLNIKHTKELVSPEDLKNQITNIRKDSKDGFTELQQKIEVVSLFDKYSVLKEKLTNGLFTTPFDITTDMIKNIIALQNRKNITNQTILDILHVNIGDSNTALKDFGFAFQEALGMKINDTDKRNKADGIIGKDTILKFISLVQTEPNKRRAKAENQDKKPEINKKSIDINKSVEYMKKRLDNLSSKEKLEISELYGTRGLHNKKIAEILGFKKIFKQEIQKKLEEFGDIFQRALNMQNIDTQIGSGTLLKFLQQKNPTFLKQRKKELNEKLQNLSIGALKNIDPWELEQLARSNNKERGLARLLNIQLPQGKNAEITFANRIQTILKFKKTDGDIGTFTLEKIWKRKIDTKLSGNAEIARLQIITQLEKFDKPRYKTYKKYMNFSSRVPKITKNGKKGAEIQNLENRLAKTRPFQRLQKRLFLNKKKGLLLDYKTKNLYVVSSNETGFVYEKVYKTAIGARGHRTPKGIFEMGIMKKGGLGKVLSNEDRMSPTAYNKKFSDEIKLKKRSKRTKQKYSKNAYIPSVQSGKVTVSTLFYSIKDGDGVGVHATNKEQSITMVGSSASHGCMRMYHADLIDLYYQNNKKNYHSIAII